MSLWLPSLVKFELFSLLIKDSLQFFPLYNHQAPISKNGNKCQILRSKAHLRWECFQKTSYFVTTQIFCALIPAQIYFDSFFCSPIVSAIQPIQANQWMIRICPNKDEWLYRIFPLSQNSWFLENIRIVSVL